MSLFEYLKLQPIEPQDDGSLSALDQFAEDETIDLTQEASGEELALEWDKIEKDMHAKDSADSL